MPDAREPYEKPEALPLAESLLRRVQDLERRQETLRAGLLDVAMLQQDELLHLGRFSSRLVAPGVGLPRLLDLLINRLRGERF